MFGGLIWLSLRHRLISEVDRDLGAVASRFEKYFRTETAEAAEGQLRDELEEFCQALPPSSYIFLPGASGFTFRYPHGAPRPRPISGISTANSPGTAKLFNLEAGAPSGMSAIRWIFCGFCC